MEVGFATHLSGSYKLLLSGALRHGSRFILLIFLRQCWLVIEMNHATKNMHIYVSIILCL